MKAKHNNLDWEIQRLNGPTSTSFRRPYMAPKVTLHRINLEFDILITSSNIRTAGPGDQRPEVENWEDESDFTHNIDF